MKNKNLTINYFNKIHKKKINKLRSILLIKTSNELSNKNNKKNSMKINGISISDLNNNYNNFEINIKNPLEKGDSNRYGNYSTNILHINFNDSILYENSNLFNKNKKLNSKEIEFLKNRTKSIISKNNLKENNNNNNKINKNIIINQNKEKESLFYLRKLANLFKNYKLFNKKDLHLKIKQENFKKTKSSNCFRNKNENSLKILINNLFDGKNNDDDNNNNFIFTKNDEKIISNSFSNNNVYKPDENDIKHSLTIKNKILKGIFIKEKILNFTDINNKNNNNNNFINYSKTIKNMKNNHKNFGTNSPILDIKKNKFNEFFLCPEINKKNFEKFNSTNIKKKITRQDLINKCLNFE